MRDISITRFPMGFRRVGMIQVEHETPNGQFMFARLPAHKAQKAIKHLESLGFINAAPSKSGTGKCCCAVPVIRMIKDRS